MSWLSFVIGFLCCYVVVAWVLVGLDGKGGIELFDGWLSTVLCAPVLIVAPLIRPIYKWRQQRKEKRKRKEREHESIQS